MDKMVQKPNYVEELLEILRSSLAADELQDQISDYHESDIAYAFEQLTEEERKRLYPLLVSEQPKMAKVTPVLNMDSDDAVDVLD